MGVKSPLTGIFYGDMSIAEFVRQKRKEYGLTQQDLSLKTGVGIRFVRELEAGKSTVRLDKVNQVLALFEAEVGVQPKDRAAR